MVAKNSSQFSLYILYSALYSWGDQRTYIGFWMRCFREDWSLGSWAVPWWNWSRLDGERRLELIKLTSKTNNSTTLRIIKSDLNDLLPNDAHDNDISKQTYIYLRLSKYMYIYIGWKHIETYHEVALHWTPYHIYDKPQNLQLICDLEICSKNSKCSD